jgi:hypothetical protein
MVLEHFDPRLRSNDLVQDVRWDPELRELLRTAPERVLDRYDLDPAERAAILADDFRRLYEMGLHPYLLGQLARLRIGNTEQAGSSAAATALVTSLLAGERDGRP